jgi:phosphonate transport system substrate-binding protein
MQDRFNVRRLHLRLQASVLALASIAASPLVQAQATAQVPAPAQPVAAAPFTIGVLPNVSARVLFASYQPMREYFERELGQKVEVATASDFRAFSDRTLKGEFQMVVIAPNIGRVAQLDAGWDLLAVYEPRIPALAVVAAENADQQPAQLRGKALAMANPQSLVALVALDWLKSQGLQAGTDFKTVVTANDDSLGAVLRSGEAPIAIMSRGELRAKPPEMQARLRVLHEIAQVPGFFVMANPRLDPAQRRRLKSLVLGFPATEEGKRFFGLSGFTNIREASEADLRFLEPYNDITRRGLGLKP